MPYKARLVLIYLIENEILTLTLVNTGSHSDILKI